MGVHMNFERERSILEILLREKRIEVKDVARRLYTSEPSVRRDLASLEKQRLIKRVHGGAVLDENGLSDIKIPFLLREYEHADEKVIIAKNAAGLVKSGDVIFLDASTSAYGTVPYLSEKRSILVITNGIKTLNALIEHGVACIGTGGEVQNSCMAFVGARAHELLENYNADICFISCRGLSPDGRLTDISSEENEVRRQMLRRSSRSYLLCTGDKVGKVFYNNLCRIDDLSGIISAGELPGALNDKKIIPDQ